MPQLEKLYSSVCSKFHLSETDDDFARDFLDIVVTEGFTAYICNMGHKLNWRKRTSLDHYSAFENNPSSSGKNHSLIGKDVCRSLLRVKCSLPCYSYLPMSGNSDCESRKAQQGSENTAEEHVVGLDLWDRWRIEYWKCFRVTGYRKKNKMGQEFFL